ncbi:MAG: sugar porter family MFS transporter [Actinomycetota bacterium]|jgi:sugar porter (SP) family MFS transporter|nr:sugar porter family MFS transporter [Actinomycetota bacterium]MDQ3430592.1 sugar porter family MFS transporter [Actinomycetota bacterium]
MSEGASSSSQNSSNALVYFFGALGGMLFGYDTGVISGAILFITTDLDLNAFYQGLVVSSLLLGAMAGAGVAGPLSDRLGRRRIILIAAIVFSVGAIGAALAPNVGVLVLFRIVLGVAVGAAALIVPLYLSEVAPTEIRGAVSSLNQLMIVVGILLAYIVNALLAASEAWRTMLGLAVVPSLVLLVGMYFMPETPRWLVSRGRDDEARDVLRQTRDEESVEREVREIKEVERDEEGGLRELAAPWVRPALIVAVGLAIFQQIIGINTIIYYAPTTLTEAGFGDQAATYANVAIGVLNVIMTLVAIRLIDRSGRVPLLVGGLVGMIVSLVVLGASSLLLPAPQSPTDPLAIITLACLAAFIASFAVSWGPTVWVMLPEILPLRIRGTAMGLAIFLHWGANFVVSQTFPILLATVGAGAVFLGYAVVAVVALLFVRSRVTETKGRSLEQIEADLQGKVAPA